MAKMTRSMAESSAYDLALEARKLLHADLQNDQDSHMVAAGNISFLTRELKAINLSVEIWVVMRFYMDGEETSRKVSRRNYYRNECCGVVIKTVANIDLAPTEDPNRHNYFVKSERAYVTLNEGCRNPEKHYKPEEGVVNEPANKKFFGELGLLKNNDPTNRGDNP